MKQFHELEKIQTLTSHKLDGLVAVESVGRVGAKNREFPLLAFRIGTEDRTKPVLGLFGGVHGIERVGTHVVLAYLESLFQQLSWDHSLRDLLTQVRIVALPLVNPGGMFLNRRANPNGVDLNRNAPVDAERGAPPLAGGHRLGPLLPWYRGQLGAAMETESQALVELVRREIFPSRAALTIDFHSGFGLVDRLWYPWAKSKKPFPDTARARAIQQLFDRTYPHHIYRIEPQSLNYTTHGDLWDYLYDEHHAQHRTEGRVLIPWTLEMGSWQWVRKNPKQLFSYLGPFNPIKPHRYRRVMRRHLTMIDFFLKAALNHQKWKDASARDGLSGAPLGSALSL